jgi:hypothetical protein
MKTMTICTVDKINNALYKLDPANTSCNENDGMHDEYLSISHYIFDAVVDGFDIRTAIENELYDAFMITAENYDIEILVNML